MADGHARVEARTPIDEMVARYSAVDADGVLATPAGEDTVVVGTRTDEVRFGMAEARLQMEGDSTS